MHDLAFFTQLVQANYPITIDAIKLISGSQASQRAIYRIRQPDGSAYIVRAYAQAAAVPDWLAGCAAPDQRAWLRQSAALLMALARRQFPAPQVVQTRAQDLIGETQQWRTLVTTYIPGRTVNATPDSLFAMGAALAQLHQLSFAPADGDGHVGTSWLEPDTAILAALDQYALLIESAPLAWQKLIADLCATLHIIQSRTDLARTLMHGDCHVQNIIQTPDGQHVLLDWDGAGRGRAVLDLGRLLLYGQFDHDTLGSWLPRADPWRVHAILTGYCQHRALDYAERSILLEAIRFSIAIGGATHVAQAQRTNWSNPQPNALARRKQWYATSAEIADLAHQTLHTLDVGGA
jgi:Ser/Thr protein kinase RdoA (MazF antagonist)